MRHFGFGVAVAVVVAFLAFGCGGSSHHGGSLPGLIGSSGGTFAVTDASSSINGSQVVVPAGAVTTPTQFTLQAGTQVSRVNYQTVGPAVQAGPSGTTFAQPVLVTILVTLPLPNGATIGDVVVLRRDASGNVTVLTPTSSTTDTVTFSVTSLGTFEGATLLPVSASASTVSASPTTVAADGVTKSTITATLKDSNGVAYQNQPVTVTLTSTGTGNTITQPAGTTDQNGVIAGAIASTVPEAKTITATVKGVAITQQATVTFTLAGGGSTAPTVASVNTNNGYTRGGNIVTVTGTNLSGATAVQFGSVAALFTVVSTTQITAAAPASAPSTVDVTVVTPSGTSPTSAADQYTYYPDELVVLDGSVAKVFSGTATGNVAPGRTLTIGGTVEGASVDIIHDELAVTLGSGAISVYPRTASGSAGPLRTISGAATGLSFPLGLAIDTAHDEIVVTDGSNHSIVVFARTANGNVAPLRSISGGSTTLNGPSGVAVDTVNDEIVVANEVAKTVVVFSRTASGNVGPLRTITGFTDPIDVAVDPVNGEIVVVDSSANSITVYARTASGAATPLRTISGANTGLVGYVGGIALDVIDDEIGVVDEITMGSGEVLVFARTANGNVPPLRVIRGSNAGLTSVHHVTH